MSYSKYLQLAIECVKDAQHISKKYSSVGTYETKLDNTPVTIADREIDTHIINKISKNFPDHGFVTEESGSVEKEFTWIVDPIDGTKYYLRNMPYYSTQLALMHNGKIVIGVVLMHLTGDLYYAELNKGAYKNMEKIHVSKVKKIKDTYLTFGSLRSIFHSEYYDKFINLLNQAYFARGMSDTLGSNLVSEGSFDVVIEVGVKIWDVAASSLIIQEAGGKVTDLKGRSLGFSTNSYVASNNFLHSKILEVFNSK